MITGRRSAWRRRAGRNPIARIAVTLAIPVALGVTIGVFIAVSGGGNSTINQAALGASASASSSASAAPSASGSTATTAAANVNCDIIVPANPLSAKGLATPYQLTGTGGMTPAQSGCQMTNAANLGAFVQATILNTRTGKLSVYDPLVITQGTTPAVAPVVPVLPRNYGRHDRLRLQRHRPAPGGRHQPRPRPGQLHRRHAGSIFGQVSFCNGINFFNEAHRLEAQGRLVVPSEGTSGKIVASGARSAGARTARSRRTSTWSTRTRPTT